MPWHAVFPSPSLQLLQLNTMQEISGNAKQDNASQHVPRRPYLRHFLELISKSDRKVFFEKRDVDCGWKEESF